MSCLRRSALHNVAVVDRTAPRSSAIRKPSRNGVRGDDDAIVLRRDLASHIQTSSRALVPDYTPKITTLTSRSPSLEQSRQSFASN
jgi:hypothetical protein